MGKNETKMQENFMLNYKKKIVEKLRFESEVINPQTTVFGKEEKLKEVLTELESTKKSLRTMNSRTKQFDKILTMGKATLDHYCLGYHKGITLSSNTIFGKASSPTTKVSPPMAKLSDEMKGKYVTHYTLSSHG